MKRRTARFFSIVAVVGAIVTVLGCNSPKRHFVALMDEADSLLASDPRSALVSLLKIDTEEIDSRAVKARYGLLFSEVFDECNIFINSDTLITPALDYYSCHGSRIQRAKTKLYSGKYKLNIHDTTALADLQRAYKLTGNGKYPAVRGEICYTIAHYYGVRADTAVVLPYAREAVESFEEADRLQQRDQAARYIGVVYSVQEQYDLALNWYSTAYRWAMERDDKAIASDCLCNIAANNYRLSDYRTAKRILIYDMPLSGLQLSTYGYKVLADIYTAEGKPDSAALVQSLASTQSSPHFIKVADSDDSSFWLKQYSITKEELMKAREERNVFRRQNELLIAQRRLTYVIIGASVAMLLFIAAFVYTRSAYRRREVSHILRNKNDIMHQISRLYYQNGDNDKLMREKLYQITSSQFDGKSFKELEHLLNVEYGGIITRIRNEFPEFSDKDINYIALICADYSPQELSVIMQTTMTAAYKRRSRYRAKLCTAQSLNRRQKALFSDK